MTRRVLVASDFNAGDRAHFALAYEFCRIVTECEGADLVAPGIDHYLERHLSRVLPAHDGHNVQRDFNRLVNGVRKRLGIRNAPTVVPFDIERNYDLFLFVAWSPQSLVELSRLRHWRQRCKVAVLYLFELWSSTLEADKRYLKLLDDFDHVFLLHSASVPRLADYTRAPCSFLPTAVDCLAASPYPDPPPRVIDVYSIGNRAPAVHRRLVGLARQRNFFYVYDSLSSTDSRVRDWAEHRLLLANMIKRSRYFIGFAPASLSLPKAQKIAGEAVLPSRLFEAAAGGAVILGSAPQCPEFAACFDWPDAVVTVSPEADDITAIIDDLDAQPERIERVRRAGAAACLLRHDWAYRWEQILATLRCEPLPRLEHRKARLREVAATIEPRGNARFGSSHPTCAETLQPSAGSTPEGQMQARFFGANRQ